MNDFGIDEAVRAVYAGKAMVARLRADGMVVPEAQEPGEMSESLARAIENLAPRFSRIFPGFREAFAQSSEPSGFDGADIEDPELIRRALNRAAQVAIRRG